VQVSVKGSVILEDHSNHPHIFCRHIQLVPHAPKDACFPLSLVLLTGPFESTLPHEHVHVCAALPLLGEDVVDQMDLADFESQMQGSETLLSIKS
jgi:hypothetical protein